MDRPGKRGDRPRFPADHARTCGRDPEPHRRGARAGRILHRDDERARDRRVLPAHRQAPGQRHRPARGQRRRRGPPVLRPSRHDLQRRCARGRPDDRWTAPARSGAAPAPRRRSPLRPRRAEPQGQHGLRHRRARRRGAGRHPAQGRGEHRHRRRGDPQGAGRGADARLARPPLPGLRGGVRVHADPRPDRRLLHQHEARLRHRLGGAGRVLVQGHDHGRALLFGPPPHPAQPQPHRRCRGRGSHDRGLDRAITRSAMRRARSRRREPSARSRPAGRSSPSSSPASACSTSTSTPIP